MGSTKMEVQASGTPTTTVVTAKNGGKPYGRIVLTLKNQLLTEEKLATTPSQLDGLDADTETDLRIYGCELIQTAGILLKLPQVAMATGQVLLQRFYYSKSLVRHPVEHTAMACVCLASKIEEAPRRARDVINVFTHIRQVNSNKVATSGSPSDVKVEGFPKIKDSPRPITPVILDQNYIQLKNQVIKAERRVLKELGFCVHIKHPHKIIVMYLQVLCLEKNVNLMQYSWNYMNDSLRTDVFVRYQPETVACACIYLTARKLKLPLPKHPAWYTIFGVEERDIRDVCVRILKLYNRPKPNVDELEKKVDELSKRYQDAKIRAKGNSGANTPNNNSPSSGENNSTQKTTGAHNAWGGFISRSGSHIAPVINNSEKKGSRSRSPSHSPKHHKRTKKHKSRSRSPIPPRKKTHKRRSYSRSRSRTNSPHKRKNRERRKSRSLSNDRENRNNERYIDRYDKYERYKEEKYEKDRYEEKDRGKKYDRDDKDRYSRRTKHRDEEKEIRDRDRSKDERSKDRRR